MNPHIIWIALALFVLYYMRIIHVESDSETFCNGRTCPTGGIADKMCSQIAESQCNIPVWQMNDCWLKTYRQCALECGHKKSTKFALGDAGDRATDAHSCNCHDYATQNCKSDNSPARSCYLSVQQKCMAGMGYAEDPDRGSPNFIKST